jgi:hypoxanthine-guanine phosphoribosyltransferase
MWLNSVLVPSKFDNKTVVLVDELYDNGTTLNAVKAKLMEELNLPSERIFTCCLFRKSKTTNAIPPDLVGFDDLPDLWLVGYGLDDAQGMQSHRQVLDCNRRRR